MNNSLTTFYEGLDFYARFYRERSSILEAKLKEAREDILRLLEEKNGAETYRQHAEASLRKASREAGTTVAELVSCKRELVVARAGFAEIIGKLKSSELALTARNVELEEDVNALERDVEEVRADLDREKNARIDEVEVVEKWLRSGIGARFMEDRLREGVLNYRDVCLHYHHPGNPDDRAN